MHLLTNYAPTKYSVMFRSVFLFLTLIFCMSFGKLPLASGASLDWDANEDADYYVVYWRTAADPEPIDQSESIPAGTTSFPLYESSGGTEYIYSVKAFNSCGNSSDFSVEITSTFSPYEEEPSIIEEPADTYSIEIAQPEAGSLIEEGVLTNFSANVYINGLLTAYDDVTWTSSIDGEFGTGAKICVDLSAGIHTIMASFTTSYDETVAETMTLTVLDQNEPPTVKIITAVPGETTQSGQVFTFTGTASDGEDGDLSGGITWLSELDGGLGKGTTIVATLSPGSHVITAKVQDSNNQEAEDTISVSTNTLPSLSVNASAAGDVTPQSTQPYMLTGTAQDAENGNLSSAISWVSDINGALGTGSQLKVNLSAGTHTLTASVTDSQKATVEKQIKVVVLSYNYPPEISISATSTGVPGDSGQPYTLSGSANDIEDGNISASITWSSSIDGSLGTGAVVQTVLSSGAHTLTGHVTDSGGKEAEIQKSLSVDAFNHPPTLTITTEAIGELSSSGQTYVLAGTAQDSDEGDLSHAIAWTSDISGALGTGASLTVTLISGTHTVTASVTDSQGSKTDVQKVIQVNTFNNAPVLSITSTPSSSLGSNGMSYVFSGSAEDSEDGDLSKSIIWSSDSKGVLGTGSSIETTLASGTHVITATVKDTKGQETSISKTITVATYNNAPELSISASASGSLGPDGQTYVLTGTATDVEDGNVSASIQWSSNTSGNLGSGSSIEVTLASGTHTITASVADTGGKEASSKKTITVDVYNYAPQIGFTATANGELGPDGQSFILAGTATDHENGDLSSSIVWSSNTISSLGTGSSIVITLASGTHTISAKVTDTGGKEASTQQTLTVAAYNNAPTISMSVDPSGELTETGQPHTMTGTATDQEDGNLSKTISWSSSKDGALGTGASLTATLTSGTHTITAIVTDSKGKTAESLKTVTVDAYNHAPKLVVSTVASGELGPDGQPYTLSGTATDTEDGNLSSAISWTSSRDGYLGQGASLLATLSSGTHSIVAKVTDNGNKETSVTKTLVVSSYNNPPEITIESAVPGVLSKAGQPYTLTASASDQEDGNLSPAITWSSSIDGSLGTGASVSKTLSAGSHTITALVSDSGSETAQAQKTIVVEAYNNAPELDISIATSGVLTAEGQPCQLSGTARDDEDGVLNSSIVWESDKDGSLGTGSSLDVTLSHGSHTITARVTDSGNLTAVEQRTLTIDTYNNGPEITFTHAVAGTLTSSGQSYTFSAEANDNEDGNLSASVIWTSSIAGTLGSGDTISVILTTGVHVIRAQVTDSGGKASSVSKEISVGVFNFKPTLNIGAVIEGEQDDTGQTFVLKASAEDTEDGDLSSSISWTSSLQGNLGTGATIEVHLAAGNHTISAMVEDTYGNVVQDDKSVTSVAVDHPPTVSAIQAAGGESTRDGQLFTFSCTATDKEDGDLSSSVVWISSAQGEIGSGPVIQVMVPLGQHTITARVDDSRNQSSESTKDITAVWVNKDPVVHIRSTEEGAEGKEGQVFTFTGDAIDEEDGNLSGSIIWTSSLTGELGQGAEVIVTLSEGTHTITAQISDNDGGQAQASTVVKIDHYNVPPVLDITSAIAGESGAESQTFEFAGSALDAEDGNIGNAIVWTSDIDGVLGSGAEIIVDLSEGDHQITATVTDSGGKQTSQTMTIASEAATGIKISVSSESFYYFKVVTVTWSGASSDVVIMKNGKSIANGGPEGTKYFWFSGSGRYKVCETQGGECSEEINIR